MNERMRAACFAGSLAHSNGQSQKYRVWFSHRHLFDSRQWPGVQGSGGTWWGALPEWGTVFAHRVPSLYQGCSIAETIPHHLRQIQETAWQP